MKYINHFKKNNTMKKLYSLLLFTLFSISIFSQMRVIDPQNQWWDSYASIENVEFQIKPAGIYYETSITFEVKASFANFDDETQLEYIYDFELSDNVVFNDSWLWIEDYISKGDIYEKSEGTQIYEDIVDRRQDPSILTKTGDRSYNFRIYPLFNNDVRKVKISYLTAYEHNGNLLESTLPLSFLFDSYESPQNVTLKVINDDNWFHTPLNDAWTVTSVDGFVTTYTMTENTIYDSKVRFSGDTQDQYKLGIYEDEDGDEKYFQISYKPEIETEQTPTYNLILLDHETDNTYIEINNVLSAISTKLNDFGPQDYFNILYQDFTPQFTGDSWLPCLPEHIQSATNEISSANHSAFSWLNVMLPSALQYIENEGHKARILIISADNDFYTQASTNDFLPIINEYIDNMSTEVTISAIDYSKYKPGIWIENNYYRGNEYMYGRLTNDHNGFYSAVNYQNEMKDALENFAQSEEVKLDQFDIVLENSGGFSYSKYISNGSDQISTDEPILITGKFIGEPDFELKFNAIHDDEVIQESLSLTANMELTSLAKDNWTSQYILANENSSDIDVKSDVVDASIENRLLSKQTVFLCLERDTSAISSNNGNGDDDISIVSTNDVDNPEVKINTYPNPFTAFVNIEIPATLTTNNEDVKIEILTADGKLVKTLDQKTVVKDEKFSIQWTPDFHLEGGIYFVKITTESESHTVKVIFVK